VLEEGVDAENAIVWFNNGRCDLRTRPNCERDLRFLTIVHRKTLKKKTTQSRTGSTSTCIENEKTLQTGAVISQLPDSIETDVNNLLANSVVSTSEIVSSILLSGNKLLRMEELAIGPSPHFIDYGRLQIDKNTSGDMFPGPSLGEKCAIRIIATP
jgi:hypothetical protein